LRSILATSFSTRIFVGSHLPYQEYCKRMFESSWSQPDELMIAAKGSLWVGFTHLADFPASQMVVSINTGVEREYRKQGIATSLVALALCFPALVRVLLISGAVQ